MLYRIRFALCLWWNIQGMSLRDAFAYPTDRENGSGDPVEDARTEMSYMGADS